MLSALISNQAIRVQNRHALMDYTTKGRGTSRLRPLLKDRRGVGVALPGADVDVRPVPVRLGQPIGAPFPATVRRLFKLTNAQLSTLAILFNEDFGITAHDTLEQRRVMFQHFIGL